jgi:hypothetical protein
MGFIFDNEFAGEVLNPRAASLITRGTMISLAWRQTKNGAKLPRRLVGPKKTCEDGSQAEGASGKRTRVRENENEL